jgi:chemotaxis protein CheX
MEANPPEIAPLIDATARDVITTMTRLVVERSEQDALPHSFVVDGVAGVVGLVGSVAANVHLVMTEATARRLVEGMIGTSEFTDADLRDAIGELTNMIAGGVKNRLDRKGFVLGLTVPSFIRSHDATITARGFTFGSVNTLKLHGVADPVRIVVFAKLVAA